MNVRENTRVEFGRLTLEERILSNQEKKIGSGTGFANKVFPGRYLIFSK